MAQLVERLVRNEEASGSNPLSSTKKRHLCKKSCINVAFLLYFCIKIHTKSRFWEGLGNVLGNKMRF